MNEIRVLDDKTIDQIAAGEVVERPMNAVKELVENACDAGATAVTVEIRDGGTTFIRVTDNGFGIAPDQVKKAFFRHATSKIQGVEDLSRLQSMGFRGEALSSIAAVSLVEIITKPKDCLTGIRYCLEGGRETEYAEVGAPDGTTVVVRDLFFNTPARKKFLKTPATEGSYVIDLMEHMALARPDVSFQLLVNRQTRFSTSGSGDLKEVIYRIYGREIAREVFPFSAKEEGVQVEGFLGTPQVVRPNRNFEFFFVNDRYIRSQVLSKGLENGYAQRLMQHKFPMAYLHFSIDAAQVDVNVHPSKMEVRFSDNQRISDFLERRVKEALQGREMIPQATLSQDPDVPAARKEGKKEPADEPQQRQAQAKDSAESLARRLLADKGPKLPPQPFEKKRLTEFVREEKMEYAAQGKAFAAAGNRTDRHKGQEKDKGREPETGKQMALFEDRILSPQAVARYQLIGQIFDTYWIASYQDKMILIDQHAAHEKVKFETLMKKVREHTAESQNLMPPLVVTLSAAEADLLSRYGEYFAQTGFEIEPFGGNSYALRAVPCELYGCPGEQLLQDILAELAEDQKPGTPAAVTERIATMACKAAVKGGQRLSFSEMEALLGQLLTLDNPYQCPHGRPTMITMSRQELERKFKRIV